MPHPFFLGWRNLAPLDERVPGRPGQQCARHLVGPPKRAGRDGRCRHHPRSIETWIANIHEYTSIIDIYQYLNTLRLGCIYIYIIDISISIIDSQLYINTTIIHQYTHQKIMAQNGIFTFIQVNSTDAGDPKKKGGQSTGRGHRIPPGDV